MKRNLTVSIAAGLMVAAALAQAEGILVAGEFDAENAIVDTTGMTGPGGSSLYHPDWVENYPFPSHYGPESD